MPRKPTNLGSYADEQITLRAARGESADFIARALGMPNQARTIGRRLAALKGNAPMRAQAEPVSDLSAPASAPANEDVPENVPENTPVEMIQQWIKRVEAGARKAEETGNLPALSSLAMRAASLAEALRKATPLPKPDPNDSPDYKALAAKGEKRLLALTLDLFKQE